MWRDLLYIPKQQKLGLLILSVLLVFLLIANLAVDSFQTSHTLEENNKDIEEEYKQLMASLQKKQQTAHKKRKRNIPFSFQPENLFPFDPNQADSITLQALGMPHWMISNLLKYREKGGYFQNKEAFQKLYGLTPTNYRILEPYLVITPKVKRNKSAFSLIDSHTLATVSTPFQLEKFDSVTVINLNKADTTLLKKIPGIGSYIANRIVNYKNQLGGYYSINQLKDIHLKADSLSKWFTVDEQDIHKLNINKVGLNRLKAHPYLNFYQAKIITEYKKRKGQIKTLKVFSLYEEFTPNDLKRLSHYVCYE